MLSRRGQRAAWLRAVVLTSGVSLILPLTVTPPAVAAPDDTAPSVIGDGMGLPDYIEGTVNTDPDTEITVGDERDGACQTLSGAVSAADLAPYRDNPPSGEGAWEYQLCAEDAAAARAAVAVYPNLAAARQHCAEPASRCGVFVYWRSRIPQLPPAPDESREGYLESFFTLSPQIGSSPHRDSRLGLITNLPTWFWNRTQTRFPRVIPDLGLFGGATATAWHLETTWQTDGRQICDDVGTEWDAGNPPQQESPDCGYVYRNIGEYEVEACSEWLIIAVVPPFFVVVFPITLCSDWTVPVKEAQVVTGGGPRRGPVR